MAQESACLARYNSRLWRRLFLAGAGASRCTVPRAATAAMHAGWYGCLPVAVVCAVCIPSARTCRVHPAGPLPPCHLFGEHLANPENVRAYIAEGLECTHLEVDGDGRHFDAIIVSHAFDGKRLVQRHQLVYGVLGDRMKEEIHALSIKALTPSEWHALNEL